LQFPSLSEFTEKVTKFELKFNNKISEGVKSISDKDPLIVEAFKTSVHLLPSPFDVMAEAIFNDFKGSDEEKFEQVKEVLEEFRSQGEDHYNDLISKLGSLHSDVLELKDSTAKQSTLLEIKVMISSMHRMLPFLTYGKIKVRQQGQPMHSGIYDDRRYFIEVTNTTSNTVAKNRQGSITVSGTEITNSSRVWEKNYQETIDIGHKEFLYLFKVSVFSENSGRNETRLYFSHPLAMDPVNEAAVEQYNDKLDKTLRILIRSENAQYPAESESMTKTVRQLINEAVED